MSEEVLSREQLNRALLARQGLLERTTVPALGMVERLAGLQAQEPLNPYLALWTRIEGFEAAELSGALERREAARGALMRGTIHLATANDFLAMQPITGPVLARSFKSSFKKRIVDVDLAALAAAGRELLAQRPHTRAELVAALEPRFPDVDGLTLGVGVTSLLPLVQVTPRGLWGQSQQATWALTEDWLPRDEAPRMSMHALISRYLRAFGPATISDMRIWSGLTGLRETVKTMRGRLRTFRDERGKQLFDVEDGLLPDPDVPAPPRFLPVYDNVLLGHEDRSRIMRERPFPFLSGAWAGTVLVDGFYGATWRLDDQTLVVEGIAERDDVTAEAQALARFIGASGDVAYEPDTLPKGEDRRSGFGRT